MTRIGSGGFAGFTLIEVLGALLIFSGGVIMVLKVTSALSYRMEYLAVKSVVNVQGQEQMDSLMVLPYASLPVGVSAGSDTVRGITYVRQLTITQKSPLLRRLQLSLDPASGSWPSYGDSTWVRDPW